MTPELKATIDSMSLYTMISHARFDPPGSKFFVGEVGKYFLSRLSRLKAEDPAGAVAVNKALSQ